MAALNHLIPYVSGDILIEMDDDDYFVNDVFSKIVSDYEKIKDYLPSILRQQSGYTATDEQMKLALNIGQNLDTTDRNLLKLIIEKYDGGPVGIETIAAAIGEDVRTIEDVCEPFLLQVGLLQRTPRGRKVSPATYRHLGYLTKRNNSVQQNLF